MKVGIVGNGYIVKTFFEMITNEIDIEIASICVRPESLEKGIELSKKYKIGNVYTNFDEFLNDDNIDTVYIGIINSLHYDYSKKSLLAGKNVICEKPFTQTLSETEELFRIADEKGVYLFEAITTLHMPMYKKAKEHIENVGKLRLVNCSFCQYSSRYDKYLNGEVAPVFNKELFGGALGDLNIYNIHFTVSLFGSPKDVKYFPTLGYNGVDTSGVLVLDYGDFKSVCVAAKDSASRSYGIIQGEKGYIEITSSLNNCEGCFVKTENFEENYVHSEKYGRMYYEMKEFFRIISSGDRDSYISLADETKAVMKVLECAYNSMA